jgi:patatin-like phospholipase/acyl hydrolase
MSSPRKHQNDLWYKYQDNHPVQIRIEQIPSLEDEPSVSDIKKQITERYNLNDVTLRIKLPTDADYKELNETLFDNCENNYNTLKNNYSISKNNPIIANNIEG